MKIFLEQSIIDVDHFLEFLQEHGYYERYNINIEWSDKLHLLVILKQRFIYNNEPWHFNSDITDQARINQAISNITDDVNKLTSKFDYRISDFRIEIKCNDVVKILEYDYTQYDNEKIDKLYKFVEIKG